MKEQNFIARASEVVGFDNIYCQDPNKAPLGGLTAQESGICCRIGLMDLNNAFQEMTLRIRPMNSTSCQVLNIY